MPQDACCWDSDFNKNLTTPSMPNIGILYTHEISHFYRQMLKKKKKKLGTGTCIWSANCYDTFSKHAKQKNFGRRLLCLFSRLNKFTLNVSPCMPHSWCSNIFFTIPHNFIGAIYLNINVIEEYRYSAEN